MVKKTTKKDLVEYVAKVADISKARAKKCLDAVTTFVTMELVGAGSFTLAPLGTLKTQWQAAMERTVFGGQVVSVPRRKTVRFKPSITLKQHINRK